MIDTAGVAMCQRTLGGRYYEFRTETAPAAESDLQVMTYDASAGRYRQWVFSSDGYTHQAEGTWDAATSTLTWTGQAEGARFEILDRFTDNGDLEWSLRRSDAQGNVVQTIGGTVTRAAKEEATAH